MHIKIICFLFLITSSLQAQLTNTNKQVIENEILKLLNDHRHSLEKQSLAFNSILKKAALNQSEYISGIKELSHNQENEVYATVFKRVKHFGGKQFERVGENVLVSIKVEFPLTENQLLILANEMYESWKNSPPHYKNMINPDYDFTGIDFCFNDEQNVIYATQVFAKKGVQIENQLSDNAFGLEEDKSECKELDIFYSNLVANMGSSIKIRGEDVIFYYSDIKQFNKIFKTEQDGLAIDLISRNQFYCSEANQLDVAANYDGILLKPIYKKDILKNNTARGDYRIRSKIGQVPKFLSDQELSHSTLVIKNNKVCKYLIPNVVPDKAYELRDIKAILYKPKKVKFIYEGIVNSAYLKYDFNTGIASPTIYPEIQDTSLDIHSVEIVSFSSVEGDLHNNIQLHEGRAEKIKEHIVQNLEIKEDQFSLRSGENWDKMNFQLSYFFADSLLEITKDSLKTLLANGDDSLPWDSLLYSQRQSTATINYYGKIVDKKKFVEVAKLNLRSAISTGQFDLANKTLYKMYESKSSWPELLYEDQIFNSISKNSELVQNSAAFLSKVYRYDIEKCTRFLDVWMHKHELLSKDAKYNLLILNTLINSALLSEWDVPSKRLANVIHPLRVELLIDDDFDDEMMLNIHISFLNYYGQINAYHKISESFDFISKYFKSRAISSKDEQDLVLFFNHWSMYQLTIEFLLSKMKSKKLDEDSLFILLKTINYYSENLDTYKELNLKAYKTNPVRWCQYVDQNFQILRDDELKKIFCKKCIRH